MCSGGGRVDNKYGNKPEYSNTAVDTHKQNNKLKRGKNNQYHRATKKYIIRE